MEVVFYYYEFRWKWVINLYMGFILVYILIVVNMVELVEDGFVFLENEVKSC